MGRNKCYEVSYSRGTQAPQHPAPEGACDCHMHIYDTRFSPSPHWQRQPPLAPVNAYRSFQKRIGTGRVVVVTPSTYGIDNRCTVDAVAQFGASARGVAVVDVDVSDAELKHLANSGIRGIRVNFVSPQPWGTTTESRLETLSRRVCDLGWHVQVFMSADHIVAMQDLLVGLPTRLVIDHLGLIPPSLGIAHPAFGVVCKLLQHGRTWVKLSGPYIASKSGYAHYDDMAAIAQAYVRAAPERMIWGSDWPHPVAPETPDDAVLFDLLADWTPDEATRQRILVDNPAELYGF